MHFLESYLSSVWMDSFETFLDSQAYVIECSVTEISEKVSLCRPRDITIQVLPTFSVYQSIILQYRYPDNRWAAEIVLLAKVFVHSI